MDDMTTRLVDAAQWLEDNGYAGWTENDVRIAESFVADLRWLDDNGWKGWTADDATTVHDFVDNLMLKEKRELSEEQIRKPR